ncbi:MAG: hypothetical protein D6698_06790 [Gammaproteobacteria bacterium]|nr:MAG: hypothetical protein D6698_06790 [Gammaproteobacteria bacterium]
MLKTVKKWLGMNTDVKLSVAPSNANIERAIMLRAKLLGRALSSEASQPRYRRTGTGNFISPQYDLKEIGVASDVEPYVSQSVRKHRELVLKEGYTITGEDEEMVSYVNRRLFEMAIVSDIPTEFWLRECVTNLIQYHNSALVFRRDMRRSTGRPIMMYGKVLAPIAAVFPLDPTTLKVDVDRYGSPVRWLQEPQTGVAKKFWPHDVIFMTMDKPTGFTFGTPYILPVLDDIRALRRLEELAVLLASREVFPLYHYKIGTDDHPAIVYDDGTTEIDEVDRKLQDIPINGKVVTSHRHTIELVSSKGGALEIGPFLEYFESRVLGGLRLSPLDLGRASSANRGCYSGDTQTLTDSGWKYYWEIDIDRDKIATVVPETGEIQYHFANSRHVYPYTGPMYHFSTEHTDCLVTPDHDMWALNGEYWEKIHAEDIQEESAFQTRFSWKGDRRVSDELISLYACFLKYGKLSHSRKEVKFVIFDKDEAKTVEQILSSVTRSHIKAYDNGTYVKIATQNSSLYDLLNESMQCKTYPKTLPDDVVFATKAQIQLFLELILDGGLPAPDSPSFYYSRTPKISAGIQILCLKAGLVSKELEGPSRLLVSLPGSGYDVVDPKQDVRVINYSGDVYCFNVPNHLFITRRNGTISVHGNTATNISKNVADAARDYQEVVSTALTQKLILPLLLEGGFDVTPDNMVKFVFPIIDREEARAMENHGLQLYLSDAITREELRRDYLSRKPMTPEQEKDTHSETAARIESRLLAKQDRANQNSVSNKATPTNQSGSKIKSRIKANDYKLAIINTFDRYRDKVVSCDDEEELENILNSLLSETANIGGRMLTGFVKEGADQACVEAGHEDPVVVGRRAISKFRENFVAKSFRKVCKTFVEAMISDVTPDQEGNTAPYRVRVRYESMVAAVERLVDTQIEVARRFGFIKAARTIGYCSVRINDGANDIEVPISSGPIIYKNLIPKSSKERISLGDLDSDV